MKINKEELFRLYMEQIDAICDVCDWKSTFGPAEIVGMICDILEKNPELEQKHELGSPDETKFLNPPLGLTKYETIWLVDIVPLLNGGLTFPEIAKKLNCGYECVETATRLCGEEEHLNYMKNSDEWKRYKYVDSHVELWNYNCVATIPEERVKWFEEFGIEIKTKK